MKYEKGRIVFIYGEKKHELEIEEIINLILNNKIFIDKIEENILKQAYFCQSHNEKFMNYCCDNNICQKCSEEFHKLHNNYIKKDINDNEIENLKKKLSYKKYNTNIFKSQILQLLKIIKDLSSNSYNENFKIVIQKKIIYKFEKIKNLLIL